MPATAIAPAAPPAPTTPPAPQPNPPPTPSPGAPVAAPEPKSDVKPGDHLNEAFAGLDELVSTQSTPDPAPKPTPKAPEKKEPAKTAPKAAEPVKPEPPAQPEKAATLRANYDKVKSDLAAMEKRYKELEEKLSKPQEDPEKKELQSKLASYDKLMEAKEKKLAELDSELKFTKYERSQEYKDKYETPWVEAYTDGRNRVTQLKIKEPDVLDAAGDVVTPGKVRQGTEADFDTLMGIVNDDDAAEFAVKLFGNKASIVLTQREKVRDLNGARIKAIEDYRKQGSEREKQLYDLSKKQKDEFVSNWQKENAAAAEKYPQWFKPEEGDDKGNALLEKGFQQADKAFGGTESMSPEEAVKLLSAVRNKAAGFDRAVYKLTQAKARIAELEEKLKAFEGSEPGDGEGGGDPASPTDPKALSMDAVVNTLDKLAK